LWNKSRLVELGKMQVSCEATEIHIWDDKALSKEPQKYRYAYEKVLQITTDENDYITICSLYLKYWKTSPHKRTQRREERHRRSGKRLHPKRPWEYGREGSFCVVIWSPGGTEEWKWFKIGFGDYLNFIFCKKQNKIWSL
jgi:hypothetical protein